MSYSLIAINGKDISDKTPGERYDYLKDKSSHLIELLSGHMVEFDNVVRNALAYGEVNF